MTFLEAFKKFNSKEFARYGGLFFKSPLDENGLKERLEQPLPDWLEEAVNKIINQSVSLDDKQ